MESPPSINQTLSASGLVRQFLQVVSCASEDLLLKKSKEVLSEYNLLIDVYRVKKGFWHFNISNLALIQVCDAVLLPDVVKVPTSPWFPFELIR